MPRYGRRPPSLIQKEEPDNNGTSKPPEELPRPTESSTWWRPPLTTWEQYDQAYPRWATQTRAPLHFWVSDGCHQHSLTETLSHIQTAISAGHDVNELDPTPSDKINCGRPLHALVESQGGGDPQKLEKLAEVLLKLGADPRLPGYGEYMGSPIEEVRRFLAGYGAGRKVEAKEENGGMATVLWLMERRIEELEGEMNVYGYFQGIISANWN